MLQRESMAEEIRSLDQPARAQLRNYGVASARSTSTSRCAEAGLGGIGVDLWVLKQAPSTGSISRPCPSCRARASHRWRSRGHARRPSTASLASMFAGRARSQSTCWSGWRT